MTASRLQERVISHEGGRLRYLIGGEGPPMVLCHGFIGSAENFDEWFDALLPRRTVVAPDLPGFGSSSPARGRHTAMTMAQAALAAARDAGIAEDGFDIGGLCLGAPAALALQRLRPQQTRSLVLHTPLLAPQLVRRRFHLQVAVMLAPGVYPAMIWLSHQRRVSDLYKRFMVEGSEVDPEAALLNFQNQVRADVRATREWLRDGLRRDDLAQVRQSIARVLVLAAKHDRIVDVGAVQIALRSAPNAQLVLMREGGHAWTREMVDAQRTVIAAFLDGAPIPQTRLTDIAA